MGCKMSEILKRYNGLLLIVLVLATFLLIKVAPTRLYVAGDLQESLVTAQSILQNKTIRLDAYYPADRPNTVVEERGRLYYYFPLGTPLLSVPFVGVQLLRGKDMLVEADNFALQKTLAALALSLSVLLVYLICRYFLGYGLSWLFTVVFVFGSSIASTVGTALWSIDFALVFMLLAVLISSMKRGCQWAACPLSSGMRPVHGLSLSPEDVDHGVTRLCLRVVGQAHVVLADGGAVRLADCSLDAVLAKRVRSVAAKLLSGFAAKRQRCLLDGSLW